MLYIAYLPGDYLLCYRMHIRIKRVDGHYCHTFLLSNVSAKTVEVTASGYRTNIKRSSSTNDRSIGKTTTSFRLVWKKIFNLPLNLVI